MKTSKTSTAAAIISFTLVGATSAFALGTGAITSNNTPAPATTPAVVEVVDAPVVATPAVAAPAVVTPAVAAPAVAAPAVAAPAVVDQVDAVGAATVPASSTDSVKSSTPDKTTDMGPEATEPSMERADKAEKADRSDKADSADKAERSDSAVDQDSRDNESADKAEQADNTPDAGGVVDTNVAPITSTVG